MQHALDVAYQPVCVRMVGLVDDEYVGDLEQPCFHRLYRIAGFGTLYDNHAIGLLHDIYFTLSHSYRFYQDDVFAGCVKQFDDRTGGLRQPAHAAPGSHAADEYSVIKIVLLHSYSVSQYGAAGEWAGGIHSHYPDLEILLSHQYRELIHQGALTHSRGAGYSYAVGSSQA